MRFDSARSGVLIMTLLEMFGVDNSYHLILTSAKVTF